MEYSAEGLRPLLRGLGLRQKDIAEECRRDNLNDNQERALRALSWVAAAQSQKQNDLQLVCAWIAFNAMYAVPSKRIKDTAVSEGAPSHYEHDNEQMDAFIERITKADGDGVLLDAVKTDQTGNLRQLIGNQYLFADYWKSFGDSRRFSMAAFSAENKIVEDALSRCDICAVLKAVLRRIRVLRNQVLHGEAGFGDYYNRLQVASCADFTLHLTGRMLGVMILAMTANPKSRWGRTLYPPQGPGPNARTEQPVPLRGR